MIETYNDLHKLITSEIEQYLQNNDQVSIKFEIADNGSCVMQNNSNGNKFKFMLARFGDEYKVGFAFFEEYQPQPVWLDDVLSSSFDENFVKTLICEHLV
ncbi:hypothetical protein QCB44_05365 [Thiomicrorhabdus sp. zzn3]|uniref:hypothetical protein n=1 Tax=Thiomicrorhabdus sp. zzn3 TaxID=3039775 RepID=UPI002436375F|nr:hypothetical protein [Thiomicrorhabdus sp. zzn3]MDG6778129.1 hypothetical protein [Thiomicrorhabdus sp. zzn3]